MRLVSVPDLPIGAEVAREVTVVQGARSLPLLRPGVRITDRTKDALTRHGICTVYIRDDDSEGIEPAQVVSAELTNQVASELANTFQDLAKSGPTTRVTGKQVERLASLTNQIIAEIRNSGSAVHALSSLGNFDPYTVGHSMNVCVLGLMIADAYGKEIGFADFRGEVRRGGHDERLTAIGVGLLLHDVGKVRVPHEILTKPGKLTDAEMARMREHPTAGVELVGQIDTSVLARVIIADHHERLDGGGYPRGKRGHQIHANARIAAVADMYDAISTSRPYRAALPAHRAREIVLEDARRGLLDTEVTRIFARTIAPYPPGVEVELADGRCGLVEATPEVAIDRPMVRILTDPDGSRVSPYTVHMVHEPSLRVVRTVSRAPDGTYAPV